jgi:hypothetical protein
MKGFDMRSHIKITRMKAMDTDQYQQVIVHVEWAKAAIADDGVKGAVFRTSDFDPQKITGAFIPFSELTEEVVLGWVMQDYEKDKDMIEKSLLGELENQRKAKAAQRVSLPWASN